MVAMAALIVLGYVVEHTNINGPGTGEVLHWVPANAPYAINQKGSASITDGSFVPAVAASFDAWNANANFHYYTGCETTLGWSDFNPTATAGSEVNIGTSIVAWSGTTDWPYGSAIIALTFNFFDQSSGEIHESDTMANDTDFVWTTGDVNVQTDVQNFITHEAGHYLGMAHSLDDQATMFATGQQGETHKRILTADDIAGVDSIYGTGSTASSGAPEVCTLKTSCQVDLAAGTRAGNGGLLGSLAALGFLGLLLALRRRRSAAVLGLVLGLGVLSVASSARATSMRDLSLAELTRDADTVVVGTVESVQTVTDGRSIHTVNRVVVQEVLAGLDFGARLEVITPGGNLPRGVPGPKGSNGLAVSGMPTFLPGDEVVLFAARGAAEPDGVVHVADLAQGKMEVVRSGGTVRLVRDLSEVRRVIRTPEGTLGDAPEADPFAGLTLDQLRLALRSLPTRGH